MIPQPIYVRVSDAPKVFSISASDLLDQRRIVMCKWADFVTGTAAQVVRLRG